MPCFSQNGRLFGKISEPTEWLEGQFSHNATLAGMLRALRTGVLSECMVRFCTVKFLGMVVLGSLLNGAVYGDSAPASKIPILTVCEALRDPGRYAGQTVILVGRSVGTEEGGWLDENCGLNVVIEGRTYPALISTAYVASDFGPPPMKPSRFKWDRHALQRALAQVKATTRLEYKAQFYAAYGRLEASPTREITRNGRVGTTVGYGHLGGAPAQLIAPADGWLRLR
jgi:hypothetical protein